jgi:hypothetical protein
MINPMVVHNFNVENFAIDSAETATERPPVVMIPSERPGTRFGPLQKSLV